MLEFLRAGAAPTYVDDEATLCAGSVAVRRSQLLLLAASHCAALAGEVHLCRLALLRGPRDAVASMLDPFPHSLASLLPVSLLEAMFADSAVYVVALSEEPCFCRLKSYVAPAARIAVWRAALRDSPLGAPYLGECVVSPVGPRRRAPRGRRRGRDSDCWFEARGCGRCAA